MYIHGDVYIFWTICLILWYWYLLFAFYYEKLLFFETILIKCEYLLELYLYNLWVGSIYEQINFPKSQYTIIFFRVFFVVEYSCRIVPFIFHLVVDILLRLRYMWKKSLTCNIIYRHNRATKLLCIYNLIVVGIIWRLIQGFLYLPFWFLPKNNNYALFHYMYYLGIYLVNLLTLFLFKIII